MTITDGYKEILQSLHERHKWGSTGGGYAGDSIVQLLTDRPEIKTILDYGCGEGSLKTHVESAGITDREWTLYDPGMKGLDKRPSGKFDLVITTDVLEHVEPEMQEKVILELMEYTDKVMFNEIACYATNRYFPNGPYKGMDLHINLRAPDMWRWIIESLAAPRGFQRLRSEVTLLDGYKVRYLSILWREHEVRNIG